VSLAGYADRKIKTYSGGMKRRLGIAQALLTRQLIEAAASYTWQFLAPAGYNVPGEWSVISALPHREGMLYHVVGPEPRGPVQAVQPLAPTLEDGYVWLRRQSASKGA
jgi:hypothetical protein